MAKNKENANERKIVVIRISGMVKVRKDVAEALDRLRLRRKYSCVLLDSNDKVFMGMLKKIRQYVAYGFIDNDTLEKLVKERGLGIDNKEFDSGKVVEGLLKGKSLKELGLKPFFRLHPPRKGIKSKLDYPKGVLGDNKEKINELIGRML